MTPRERKAAMNELYADRFRRKVKGKLVTPKTRRRRERRERVLVREEKWLRDSGIPRDERFPLA